MNNNYKNKWFIVAIILIVTALSGCSNRQEPYELAAKPSVITSLKQYTMESLLVPGDKLEIAVYRNVEISRTVVIRADGYISLPLLDDIKASGLTILELDAKITRKLSSRLRLPEVTVILVNPMEPMVYVYGEVGVSQPVPLRQARTLALALAHVGGITRDAAVEDIALVRLDDDGFIRMHILDDRAEGPIGHYMAYQNVALRANDLVIVPESSRSLTGRFITDFIITPLSAFNLMLTPYFQYKLIRDLD